MKTIFLVRHGQDEDNANEILNGRRDTPLTKLGIKQANEVAKKLVDKKIDVIYSSPLKRALQTAQIIAKKLDIYKVIEDDLLMERDFGIFTGKPVKDIAKISKDYYVGDKVTYFFDGEKTENFPTLLKRAKKILTTIQRQHHNKNVLIVSHGDLNKMIRAAFYEWTWERGIKTPYLENTSIIELSPNKLAG